MKISCTAKARPYCKIGSNECCVTCPLNDDCKRTNLERGNKLIPCTKEHIESLRECVFCKIEVGE